LTISANYGQYQNYCPSHQSSIDMKQRLLLFILAILTFIYFYHPAAPAAPMAQAASPEPPRATVVVVAPAPPTYSRWKSGLTAQNDWKTGPNAQTHFEPFAPSEHATWNQTSGYTIVSGAVVRRSSHTASGIQGR
jgi:hypothetical protein